MNSKIENLELLLAKGQDNALLHYSLGSEYLKEQNFLIAITHFAKAVELNPNYSAAWKAYGKALTEDKQWLQAMEIYKQGIEVAEKRGDQQAAKEMKVFLKRLQKRSSQEE